MIEQTRPRQRRSRSSSLGKRGTYSIALPRPYADLARRLSVTEGGCRPDKANLSMGLAIICREYCAAAGITEEELRAWDGG